MRSCSCRERSLVVAVRLMGMASYYLLYYHYLPGFAFCFSITFCAARGSRLTPNARRSKRKRELSDSLTLRAKHQAPSTPTKASTLHIHIHIHY
jgi:hypothetical protein